MYHYTNLKPLESLSNAHTTNLYNKRNDQRKRIKVFNKMINCQLEDR